jgi:hypothetical protein
MGIRQSLIAQSMLSQANINISYKCLSRGDCQSHKVIFKSCIRMTTLIICPNRNSHDRLHSHNLNRRNSHIITEMNIDNILMKSKKVQEIC